MAPMRGAAGARGLMVGARAPVGARAAPQPSKEKKEKIIIMLSGLDLGAEA